MRFQKVEISPKWLNDLYFGDGEEVNQETINEFFDKGLIIVIEGVRAIDAFEVFNALINLDEARKCAYLKHPEIIYAGPDGSNYSIAFRFVGRNAKQ